MQQDSLSDNVKKGIIPRIRNSRMMQKSKGMYIPHVIKQALCLAVSMTPGFLPLPLALSLHTCKGTFINAWCSLFPLLNPSHPSPPCLPLSCSQSCPLCECDSLSPLWLYSSLPLTLSLSSPIPLSHPLSFSLSLSLSHPLSRPFSFSLLPPLFTSLPHTHAPSLYVPASPSPSSSPSHSLLPSPL
jgi:hypothetical protein